MHHALYCHHISTKTLLTFSANFNFLNASNCFNLCNFLLLLTHPYSCITAMTTDHSIYPIYSMVGASSSQPFSSLPSSCLSPPPPHHLPQPSPSLSPFPWKCPPHAHPTNPQPTRHPHSHNPWH